MDELIRNYLDHIEQMKSEKPKEVKFSVVLSDDVSKDLVELGKKLGLNRAALSRDLITIGVEALKKELGQ